MSYTSFRFFAFVAVVLLLYFNFPRRNRWVILLGASYYFYLLISWRLVGYILFTTACTFLGALQLERIALRGKDTLAQHKKDWDREAKKAFKARVTRRKRRILTAVLAANFGILIFLKYYNFLAGSLNDLLLSRSIAFSAPTLKLLLPLGISFYTFQSMGYLIDVYWEKTAAEKNIARFALFVSFFPQIVQGPISIYDQLAHQLYEPHDFDFTRVKHGAELMLWGAFRKLVIADRAVAVLNAGIEAYADCNGTAQALLVLLYALQIYADFAGGIDISIGVAQMLGIDMVPNFRQPYFARSVSEFWNRWHMTLGGWFKRYLFYPLAMSASFSGLGKRIRKTAFGATKAGQHTAKVLPTSLASFVVFLLVGAWHGANWKYLGFGLWNGGIIMLSSLLAPVYAAVVEKLRINAKGLCFRLFQILRTFLVVLGGFVFDIAPDLTQSIRTFPRFFTDFSVSTALMQLRELGMDSRWLGILVFGALLMLAVDVYHECCGSNTLRKLLDTKPFPVRYVLILGCLLATLYYGIWGPNVGAAAFVYMQF